MNSKLRDILEEYGNALIDKCEQAAFKPKTIKADDVYKFVEENMDKAEKAIRQAVGEEMLELVGSVQEYDEGDGWDIVFSQADAKNAEGKVIKKGKERSCCPGDDIAYVRNMTIAELRQKIKEWAAHQGAI